jgi:hypothetical protein
MIDPRSYTSQLVFLSPMVVQRRYARSNPPPDPCCLQLQHDERGTKSESHSQQPRGNNKRSASNSESPAPTTLELASRAPARTSESSRTSLLSIIGVACRLLFSLLFCPVFPLSVVPCSFPCCHASLPCFLRPGFLLLLACFELMNSGERGGTVDRGGRSAERLVAEV